ncbi:alpha/beta hydrolase [Halopseudomonas sp.]|uniref:alpha/beta hydrolase n=1 Tax=Halopseudomonas sp. TaxID=2901191 RepID=UPI00311F041B
MRSLAGAAKGGVLLLAALLCACQSHFSRLQDLAGQHDRRAEVLSDTPLPLAFVGPGNTVAAPRLRVYIEGDGRAWATPTQPSSNPSPRHLLVAELAFSDPTPSLYLARPCQFIKGPRCGTELWTSHRYSETIVQNLDQALNELKARYHNREFELIGYSGGATMALLLASRRADVTQVQTLAGNLSPRYWTQLKQLTPLTGSLEPLDQQHNLASVPQRHLVGEADTVVPTEVLDYYQSRLGAASCIETVKLPNVSHARGWQQAWRQWRDRPLDCASHVTH